MDQKALGPRASFFFLVSFFLFFTPSQMIPQLNGYGSQREKRHAGWSSAQEKGCTASYRAIVIVDRREFSADKIFARLGADWIRCLLNKFLSLCRK
ncbi:hypothetical protein B9Z19DRAFT_1079178 [Tuber borchii]|uniref:Uncharacterized protein n=1 Tax=Tuber borchii TaxID=42251 RepID=A0A2T6ZYH8_TUBBO|nr:hypothetical protein B9Z19DRAFT_1079178 [Tuber borchii]